MHAHAGDWLVVKGVRVDLPEQRGRIVSVGGPEGGPPFTVRWLADDHVSTIFPGPDALVLTEAELTEQDEHDRERFERLRALRHTGEGVRHA
ncbi:DUF1918 domain-containing protein [Amycolatopsis benzoatilytica]|uniref:DUF1918 domain-containing protein n=1 Tax=Amycolatopsis benzoatilytica TaxID=346045 RepID=UPI0003627350|nr:DUF1918 domain-containing protein [Amycolatopsis benzoatilytica]